MLVYFSVQMRCHVYFTGKSFPLQVGGNITYNQHNITYNQRIFYPTVERWDTLAEKRPHNTCSFKRRQLHTVHIKRDRLASEEQRNGCFSFVYFWDWISWGRPGWQWTPDLLPESWVLRLPACAAAKRFQSEWLSLSTSETRKWVCSRGRENES